MGEVICLHIGQAGVQIGNSCWELFCLEHGIQPDGQMAPEKTTDDSTYTLFSKSSEKLVARSIFIDLEPTCIDEVRTGSYKQLFEPKNLISSKEDACNIASRGKYNAGRELIDTALDRVAREVDKCVSFQGFMIFSSVNGGAGGGFGVRFINRLTVDYAKTVRFAFTVLPSNQFCTNTVEPYNAVLATSQTADQLNATFAFENERLYNMCSNQLGIENPTYSSINRLIAQVASSVTAPLRFEGPLSSKLRQFSSSLVPYPNLNYILSSCSSLIPSNKILSEPPTVASITDAAFFPENCMAEVDLGRGKYIASTSLYRGDVPFKEAFTALNAKKADKTIRFIESPSLSKNLSIGINSQAPFGGKDMGKVSRVLCQLSNNTAIRSRFAALAKKFDSMYAKRAFVHWFVLEGMEGGELGEARENLVRAIEEYAKIEEVEPEEVVADENEEEQKMQQRTQSRNDIGKEFSASKDQLGEGDLNDPALNQEEQQGRELGDADNQVNDDDDV